MISVKKIWSCLCILCLSVCLLSGCITESAQESAAEDTEEMTLEVWMCYDRNVPGSYYVFLWDTLEEEYGCTINVKTYSQQEIEDKLKMAVACNELPDIFMVPGGSYPEYLFAAGACLPVTSYLEETDFLEAYTLSYEDGENYLIPCLPESVAVAYYDTSLLEEMNVSVPQTWEELLELVEQVHAYNEEHGTDYDAIELGMKDSWMGELLYCVLAAKLDEDTYRSLYEAQEEDEDSSLYEAQEEDEDSSLYEAQEEDDVNELSEETSVLLTETAARIQQLVDADAFPDSFSEIGEQEAVKNFINHKAVLMVHQSSLVYHLTQNMGVSGFLLEDFLEEEGDNLLLEINSTYTPGLAISSRSAYAEEAAAICLDFAQRINQTNVEQYNYLNMTATNYTPEKTSYQNVVTLHTLVEDTTQKTAFLRSVLSSDAIDSWDTMTKRFFAGDMESTFYGEELASLLTSE